MDARPASWRQFRIRTILLLTVGIAILLGWYATAQSRYTANLRATEFLREHGAQVEWYIQSFPQFDKVTRVAMRGVKPVEDDYRVLAGLSDLAYLSLADTPTTDDDVTVLLRLVNLQQLDLSGTKVTDVTLVNLATLRSLSVLNVERTQVTPAGLAGLATKRPDLVVESGAGKD